MRETVISVKELRRHLSKYLYCVERGETIKITRRGRIICRVLPEEVYISERMSGLVKSGVISWGGKPLTPWKPFSTNKGPVLVSDLVSQERR